MHNRLPLRGDSGRFCGSVLNSPQLAVFSLIYFYEQKMTSYVSGL
ncbi:hypothetical protein C4K29_0354 [Pseudomonas chlororaphis subsp. piscium]|nr:hypothetical protein C4K33_0350 [Pseudomonas chlororaphis subsp. piscium]AZC86686.1 hypothetical protein C4K29_0354 [Pseudomonas chlororaphis subsp. piscium]